MVVAIVPRDVARNVAIQADITVSYVCEIGAIYPNFGHVAACGRRELAKVFVKHPIAHLPPGLPPDLVDIDSSGLLSLFVVIFIERHHVAFGDFCSTSKSLM